MPAPKNWQNGSEGGTPINATALIDLEQRLGTNSVGFNIFNGADFPTRPDFGVVLWMGGGLADDPTADMQDGDVWFPSEE